MHAVGWGVGRVERKHVLNCPPGNFNSTPNQTYHLVLENPHYYTSSLCLLLRKKWSETFFCMKSHDTQQGRVANHLFLLKGEYSESEGGKKKLLVLGFLKKTTRQQSIKTSRSVSREILYTYILHCDTWVSKSVTYLHQLVGMFTENLGVFLHLLLIPALRSLNENQQGDIGFQERIWDVIHHSFPKLQLKRKAGRH